MSSLRPLITITLLAGVGVFLYMKINETEPALPPGLEEWTTGGFDVGVGDAADATASSSPATTWPPTYDAGAAPPFTASAPAPNASTAQAPAGDAAPPWAPSSAAPAATDAPKISASLTPSDDSSPVARSATPPADILPEMPPLPGTTPADPAAKPDAEIKSSDAIAAGAVAAGAIAAAAATADKDEAPAFTVDAPPLAAETTPPTVAAPSAEAAAPSSPSAAASDAVGANPITPTDPAATAAAAAPTDAPPAAKSMYASVRVAVQGALDRGELAQALLLLSDWYGDPSLTPEETKEVESLLGQLAGSVIYEGPPAHRLEQPYIVQAGETLDAVAEKYNVPAALLAKINGIAEPAKLEAGRELKVVRGPFSAIVDLSEREMTLMLDRRYAGQFALELDPATTIEEGQWKVDQKLLSPAGGGLYGQPAAAGGEDRSLLLANLAAPAAPAVVVRGPGQNDPIAAAPAGRTVRLKGNEVSDVYDILSVGSRVTVRR